MPLIAALLVCGPLVLLGLACWRRGHCAAEAALVAMAYWGSLCAFATELLGSLHALRPFWIALTWGLATISALGLWLRRPRAHTFSLPAAVAVPKHSLRWLLGGVAVIMAAVGLIAIVAPPNNCDSMTYHMSRVEHWLQNESVAHYPTHITRQLISNPFAEYAILHLQALSNGDRLANLVQWSSLLGCLVGVSLIARQLGAETRGQVYAVVFAASIPMAVLQASSTQNDLVSGLWLVSFVALGQAYLERSDTVTGVGAALSLGLALLTKAVAYFYAAPLILWLVVLVVWRHRSRCGPPLVALMLFPMLLSAPFFLRNLSLWGTPFGNAAAEPVRYANETLSLSTLGSNLMRNTALHLGSTSPFTNARIKLLVAGWQRTLGWNPDDPRTTFFRSKFYISTLRRHEDYAGNPLHLVAALLATTLLVARARDRRLHSRAVHLLLAVLVGYLLFCLLLRWQPWHTRLHLPLFLLFAPLFGVALASLKVRWIADMVAGVLLLAAWPWVLNNELRPLLGPRSVLTTPRHDQYLAGQRYSGPRAEEAYRSGIAHLEQMRCGQIGVILEGNGYEYPIWAFLKGRKGAGFRLEHVLVRNLSAQTAPSDEPSFTPCAVLAVDADPGDRFVLADRTYVRVWSSSSASVHVGE
jgi:hypothetical protein